MNVSSPTYSEESTFCYRTLIVNLLNTMNILVILDGV